MGEIEITDHDAPVWNAAVEKAVEEIEGRTKWGQVQCGSEALVMALRGLIRPVLSPEQSAAEVEGAREAIRDAFDKHAAKVRALRDQFAGQTLAGIARSPIDPGVVGREAHIASIAHYAYAIADAMLAERAKGAP